jgi:hypothetical protein
MDLVIEELLFVAQGAKQERLNVKADALAIAAVRASSIQVQVQEGADLAHDRFKDLRILGRLAFHKATAQQSGDRLIGIAAQHLPLLAGRGQTETPAVGKRKDPFRIGFAGARRPALAQILQHLGQRKAQVEGHLTGNTLDPSVNALSEAIQIDRGTQLIAVANRKLGGPAGAYGGALCSGQQAIQKGDDIDRTSRVDRGLVVPA